jgi:hypothetical protein
MDLIPYVVDWGKARGFKAGGVFEEEFDRARERRRGWAQPDEEFPSFDAYYFAVARAFESLRGALPADAGEGAAAFFQGVIAEGGVRQDFGDEALFRCDREAGRFLHSMSPESAAEFAALGHGLDWPALKAAYGRKVSRADQKELAGLALVEGKRDGFEGCFRPYVERWVELLDRACSKKWGILTELQ